MTLTSIVINVFIQHFCFCFLFFFYVDFESPVITSSTTQVTALKDPGQTTVLATWTEPTVTDNSGVYTMTLSHNSGSSFDIGITTVTYTAVDMAGNVATYSFNVSVKGR